MLILHCTSDFVTKLNSAQNLNLNFITNAATTNNNNNNNIHF